VSKIAFILKESIPPFHFLAKIIQTLSRAEQSTDIRELIRVIKQEPATTAKVLQVANSAAYMGSKEISSIESASALMGITALKSVVLSSVIASKFNTRKCPNFNAKEYWLESVLTGENTASIYTKINKNTANDIDIYCIGLLSNIGLLFLVDQFPDLLSNLISEISEDKSLSLLLSESFGLNEFELSAKLLHFWKLPDIFSETAKSILNYEYSNKYSDCVDTIRAAKKITQLTLTKVADEIEDLDEISELNLLNFSNETFMDITTNSFNNLEKNKLIAEAICR